MPSIEVIYENGVFRPVHPLDLEEGTRLEMTVIRIDSTAPNKTFPGQDRGNRHEQEGGDTGQVDEATYKAFLSQLDSITALPLQSPPQPHAARDHDAILYPKQGTMP